MKNQIFQFKIRKRALSWNKFYAGKHWAVRKKLADEWHEDVMYALMEAKIPRKLLMKEKAIISIEAVMSKPVDPDNICSKLIIDPMVKYGLLKDDNNKYVFSVTLLSTNAGKGQDDYVQVSIAKAPTSWDN